MNKSVTSLVAKLLVLLVVTSLLALPACMASPPSPQEVTSYTIADTTGDWGYPSPYTHYSRGPGYVRMSLIFETLIWKNDSGFIPALAKEWKYDEEENAYIFKLRNDVAWHDGNKFTAHDVVFTFGYTREHPYQWVDSSIVSSAKAIDKYTVKVYLSQPYAPFLNDIAGTQPILPKHIWQNVTEPEKFTVPQAVIGTGPYMLADYSRKHGTYLYQAYTDYYLGKPIVDEIKLVKISAEMIPAALNGGSVNAGSVPPEVVSEMKEKGLTIIMAPYAWSAKLMINHNKAPLSSKQFRQALAYAIDREALVEISERGHAMAGSPGMIPPTSGWYDPGTPQYKHDPVKAKQLFEGLGYRLKNGYLAKDGQELRLELIAASRLAGSSFKDVGQLIAQQLEKVGIKVEFRTMEAKTVDAKVGAWDFDLAICGHGGLYEPSILNKVILGKWFNSARYELNQRLNQLLRAQLSEMDAKERGDLVFQIQEICAEELPALTLYYPNWYWAHDDSINLFYTKDGVANGIPLPLNRLAFVK